MPVKNGLLRSPDFFPSGTLINLGIICELGLYSNSPFVYQKNPGKAQMNSFPHNGQQLGLAEKPKNAAAQLIPVIISRQDEVYPAISGLEELAGSAIHVFQSMTAIDC